MKTSFKEISIQTKDYLDITDITDQVIDFVSKSDIKDGLINIQTLHTTATVLINENEPLLIEDLKANLDKIGPRTISYKHDDFSKRTVNMCDDECQNGHAHCKAIHLPVNVCLNLIDGKIQLGVWQKIMFVELDKPRQRKVQIQIIGL